MRMTARAAFGAIVLVSFGAVAAALVTQHVFEMQPCPWCVLQRLIFVLIGLVALVALTWPGIGVRRASAFGLFLLGGAGVAAALWQHFVAAASTSCNLTLADRIMNGSGLPALLPDVFEARATCADAAVRLLGLPYEFWALGLFVVIAIAALWPLTVTAPSANRR